MVNKDWKNIVIREVGRISAEILKNRIYNNINIKTRARQGFSEYMIYGYDGFFLYLIYKSKQIKNVKQKFESLRSSNISNLFKNDKSNTEGRDEDYDLYFAIILYLLEKIGLIKFNEEDIKSDDNFLKAIIREIFVSDKAKKVKLQNYVEEILTILKHLLTIFPK